MDISVNQKIRIPLKEIQEESDRELYANIIRHALDAWVPVPAVKYVYFKQNKTTFPCEIIAGIMGRIPILNSKFDERNKKFDFEVSGPSMEDDESEYYFSTDDIPDLPVAFKVPILRLGREEKLSGSLVVETDTFGNSENSRHKAFASISFGLTIGNEMYVEAVSRGIYNNPEEIEQILPNAIVQTVKSSKRYELYWGLLGKDLDVNQGNIFNKISMV